MKKIMLLGFCTLVLFGLQSCKRSAESVARSYCEHVRQCLEDRQLDKIDKYSKLASEYLATASEEDQQTFINSAKKYEKEFKLDSIYDVVMREEMRKQGIPDDVAIENVNDTIDVEKPAQVPVE